ncbi:MAG: peptide chain release factor 2 [Rubrivivax sp.]|nr:peptide chain release factor 2 [Rubrivivax sp.]
MLAELRERYNTVRRRAGEMGGYFDLAARRAKIDELTEQTVAPDFWNDHQAAQETLRALSRLKLYLEPWDKLSAQLEDVGVLLELAEEAGDEETATAEVEPELAACEQTLERLEIAAMLSGQYDDHDAILEIGVGAGGTDACDWTEMLLRMYLRWAERQGFEAEILEVMPGEEAGLRSATLRIAGQNAYGLLRSEAGVHRLVRISPFDSNARRQTSFAGVTIMPDVADEVDIDIDERHLRVDTYRSSGAGGQHVNKTDSAVRLTYQPPELDRPLVVQCQNERSQHKNKATAMKVLKAKLYEIMREQHAERLEDLRGKVTEFAWGNQIRNYTLNPFRLVKDTRTGLERGDTDAVLDGDLNAFIEAYLRQTAGHHAV